MISREPQEDQVTRTAFGALLAQLRRQAGPRKVKQTALLAHLPGWSHSSYSRLEDGSLSPQFEHLPSLYAALLRAGVSFTALDRQQFVQLARARVQLQQTYKDRRTDAEWAQLLVDLMEVESHEGEQALVSSRTAPPALSEIRHLIDRPLWHEEMLGLLSAARGKKLVIVRGGAGVGKSSELSWLATYFLSRTAFQVRLCNLRARSPSRTPEEALSMVLATLLTEPGSSLPHLSMLSFEHQTALVLERLGQAERPVLLLIDHGECLVQEPGRLASCWEQFLAAFLRSRHQAKVVLATRDWPGWTGSDPLFVDETTVPPLLLDQAVQLLERLGLEEVPHAHLCEVYHTMGGVPLCLEWVAALIKHQPRWDILDLQESAASSSGLTSAVQRLLREPRVFAGPPEHLVAPFFDRLLSAQALTPEARHVLQVLSVASIPLGRPALEVLCPSGPGPYEDLRRASLVVALHARTQLLPMVASFVLHSLSAEQIQDAEGLLIEAYSAWLRDEHISEPEAGDIVTELAALLLLHRRLVEAAELLIRYGWLSFNRGSAYRLARLASEVLAGPETEESLSQRCGSRLLYYFLAPFLGTTLDAGARVQAYRLVRSALLAGQIALHPISEVYLSRLLMVYAMSEHHFDEAEELARLTRERLAARLTTNPDLEAALLELDALQLGRRSDDAEEQGEQEGAARLREQAIGRYRQAAHLLATPAPVPPLRRSLLKKRLARVLTNLGYQLDRAGRAQEALSVIEGSIALKEQGYVEPGSLAASYGEKSQALAALGRYEEALRYDALALEEVERLAGAGDTLSQEERWIYLVNRACLYLQLGRVDEAEQLLRTACPHILPTRRSFAMLAQQRLAEIEAWRAQSSSSSYQRDWRWVERFRQAISFNAFWWLAHAGPFTAEEQQRWQEALAHESEEAGHKQLEALIAASRERELHEAETSERAPRLWYPAIPIADVHRRIADLLALQEEIHQHEQSEPFRTLYEEAITERVCFLRLIAATHQRDNERFQEMNRALHPPPTRREMGVALACVSKVIRQGFARPQTAEASQRVLDLLDGQLGLSLVPESEGPDPFNLPAEGPLAPPERGRMIKAQAAMRFYEAALREGGCLGWRVLLDGNAHGPRVEAASRLLILPDAPLSLEQVKSYLAHELLNHVADAAAGERSLLGLLAIGTRNYMPTSEGLALYREMQAARAAGSAFDDSKVWLGTLSAGLASGCMTPAQTFYPLAVFLEAFLALYRQLRRPDEDRLTRERKARELSITLCLRTFRGVPDLEQAGVCYSKDVVYLRGLLLIEQAVAEDPRLLARLSVGRVALEALPTVERLGVMPVVHPLRKLVEAPDLESTILSFETQGTGQ